MEWRRITAPEDPDFERVFGLYQEGFPLHEQRTREKQEAVLNNPAYFCCSLWDGAGFAGLLMLWEGPGFTYVEHFAVVPERRGGGFGGRVLARLIEQGKPVVLEIDPPADGISRRRQGFYERAGFSANPWPHVHPPYRSGFAGHELVVMTCPGPWGWPQYEAFAAFLRDTVMADCKYQNK